MVEKFSPSESRSMLHSYAWLIALIGLLFFIGSSIAYILNRSWAIQSQVGAGIGIMFLLGAVLLRPDAVRSVLTRRPVKYASNAIVKTLAFIGILALINFLTIEYEWEYDLTETGQFTLSEQTIQILQQLDRPVEVIGFFQSHDPRLSLAEDYLERYSHYTDYLTYEFYDPGIEPALAQKYKLSNYGLIFVSGDNYYETSSVDELTITSGLMRITSDTIDWPAEEEDLISVRPKQPTNRRLFLTPLQTNITIFTTLIIIPAAVLIAGVAVWWKRR